MGHESVKSSLTVINKKLNEIIAYKIYVNLIYSHQDLITSLHSSTFTCHEVIEPINQMDFNVNNFTSFFYHVPRKLQFEKANLEKGLVRSIVSCLWDHF